MYAAINGTGNAKSVYIMQSFRKEDGHTSTRVHRSLGRLDELLAKFDGSRDALMAWAKEEAKKETAAYKAHAGKVIVSLSQSTCIPASVERSFQVGYLFLQQVCAALQLEDVCKAIKRRRKITYDLGAILSDLVYARILSPSSKMASYEFCRTLLEPPRYALQNVYRALSVLAEETDFIQEALYKNSEAVHSRNTTVLYYDCTNYYFEIEQEDDFRKYGKSKEHRPNPIVTMGLFMDADGIPLAFDVFPGNQSEQTTLKPLERRAVKDFSCKRFIYCSDAGLGSTANRAYNSMGERSYVITHSLKKMKKADRDAAMRPEYFKAPGRKGFVDISSLDESDPEVFNTTYYKEMPLKTEGLDETLIITYSPKYKAYQRRIRELQVARAKKMTGTSGKAQRTSNPNDPARFVKETAVTDDGEIAGRYVRGLDKDKICDEARYDGFYAVVTNIDGDPREILKINQRRWEIEESFRIMKTEFEARPVYVRREDRIKAHFLTCYIALLVYRLLEKLLGDSFTCEEILGTLSAMKVAVVGNEVGYIPTYKRTPLTDKLHDIAGFRTDYEVMTKAAIRKIIKASKKAAPKS